MFDIVWPVEPAFDLSLQPTPLQPTPAPSTPASSTPALSALVERVAPITLAREQTLPLPEMLADVFPEGGLVRGRSLWCNGPSATSLALTVVAPAIAAGGWLALIDLPTIGLDAASEYGVPLERIVRVDTAPARTDRWADVVAAAADGFDVLLTRVPSDVSPSTLRKVMNRVQQRGAVVVVLGDPGQLTCDAELHVDEAVWGGVAAGSGHLDRRWVTVRSAGRRMPGRCRRELPLPAAAP